MLDEALYWLGAATAICAGVGLASVTFIWALDRLLKATGYAKTVMHWYVAEQIKKRDAKRHPA